MINNFHQDQVAVTEYEYPPGPYIEVLSKKAHSAIGTYIKLWRVKNNKNIIYIYRDEIQSFFMREKEKFMKHLALIGDEGLLNWKEEKKSNDDITRTLYTIDA